MLRDDFDRLSHCLRVLLPILVFFLPFPFRFGGGIKAGHFSLLGGAFLWGDCDPERRSRWSGRRSDVYHI